MRILSLETSSEYGLLAVISDSGVVEIPLPGGPELSKSLGAHIQRLTGPFDRIVVGTGPGSFTGIRVGAAMAQALSYGWQIPLFIASSLSAFAPPEPDFAVAVDARSGGLYIQIGVNPPEKMPLDAAERALQQAPLIVSPHPERILARLPHLSGRPWREAKPSALPLVQHAIPAPIPLVLQYLS